VQVLKWSKNLPGAQLTFQREWMLGRRLNAAARQDPMLNILLQTGKQSCLPQLMQDEQLPNSRICSYKACCCQLQAGLKTGNDLPQGAATTAANG
jgi:hypothetical protein